MLRIQPKFNRRIRPLSLDWFDENGFIFQRIMLQKFISTSLVLQTNLLSNYFSDLLIGDTQHNITQHKDLQHIQHIDTQHLVSLHQVSLCWGSFMLNVVFFSVMLRIVQLSFMLSVTFSLICWISLFREPFMMSVALFNAECRRAECHGAVDNLVSVVNLILV